MKVVFIALGALALAGLLYIRLAPADPARWHVDPVEAADPGRRGVRVPPGRIISAQPPEALLEAFAAVMAAEPRARLLAGAPSEGLMTYEIRSRWVGFPDYLSVRALPEGAGSTLAVLSRLRFGRSDLGVNRGRLDALLARLAVERD